MQRRLERRRSIVCCTVFFLQALGLPKKLDSFYSPCVFSWIPGALIGCTSSRKFKVPTGEFDGLVYTDGKGDPPSPSSLDKSDTSWASVWSVLTSCFRAGP